MPNVSLKTGPVNVVPRTASKEAALAVIAAHTSQRWPFVSGVTGDRIFQNTESGYDLAHCLYGRGTAWQYDAALSWGGNAPAPLPGRDFDGAITVTAAPLETLMERVIPNQITGITGINPADPIDSGVASLAVEEESLAHPDYAIGPGFFTSVGYSSGTYETDDGTGIGQPVDWSASVTVGGFTTEWFPALFGGACMAPAFYWSMSAGLIGNPLVHLVSDGAGYEENLYHVFVSTDTKDFPDGLSTSCGTLTVNWFHPVNGFVSVSCPIYTVNVALLSGGGSRSVSCSVDLTQTAGLQYGGVYLPTGEKA